MNSKTNNKNGTNNKFLLCCRPPMTPIVGMDMNDAGRVRPVAASLSVDYDDSNNNKEVNDVKRKKKKGGGKKLLHALKSVWFETSLAKKIRKRKLKQKLYQSKEKMLTDPEKSKNDNSLHQELYKDENGKIVSTTSSLRSSSAFTSSTLCSSSISSNSRSLSGRNTSFSFDRKIQKQDNNVQAHGKGCYGPNIGLCFILISLLVLVFWGKICAIFCTSTWLFFLPRWTISNNSLENFSSKVDSEANKKRIIIEGLLERNHSRGR